MTGMAGLITGGVAQMKFGSGAAAAGSTQTKVIRFAAAAARPPRATPCTPANCPVVHLGPLLVAFLGYKA